MNYDKAQDKPSDDGTRERVTGPFKGYHVAALGCFVGGDGPGYRGYYKICRDDPQSYWAAESPMAQGRCGPESSSGFAAMRMAESAAAAQLEGMAVHSPYAHWRDGPAPHSSPAHSLTVPSPAEPHDHPPAAPIRLRRSTRTKDMP